jgi:predicted O-methyltransferase YrrM
MNDLEKLGKKYGTDKIGKHNYLPYYFNLFKERRNEVKKVLEIGAGEGASLRMWRDFFPNAMIYCGEIDEKRIFKEDRIEVIKCDQTIYRDLDTLIEKTGGDIDLVIDDGSHKPIDQISTCLVLMNKLHFGAIYVIEDVSNPKIINNLDKFYPKEIKVGKRHDDRLIVMEIDE